MSETHPTPEPENAVLGDTTPEHTTRGPSGRKWHEDLLDRATNIGDRLLARRTCYVYALDEEMRVYRAQEGDTLIRATRRRKTWAKGSVQARRFGNRYVFVARGPEILPWPNAIQHWDKDDHGGRILITPEWIDMQVRTADTEAWMKGVKGMSLADRLIHLAAGAGIGMVLVFLLLKLIGLGAEYGPQLANAAGGA